MEHAAPAVLLWLENSALGELANVLHTQMPYVEGSGAWARNHHLRQ